MKQGLTVAVGLILAAGGVSAVWQGYDIVQLERGWSMVIAGTSAFVGGLIIAALGLLIGAVDRVATVLESQTMASAPFTAFGANPSVVAYAPEGVPMAVDLFDPSEHATNDGLDLATTPVPRHTTMLDRLRASGPTRSANHPEA